MVAVDRVTRKPAMQHHTAEPTPGFLTLRRDIGPPQRPQKPGRPRARPSCRS
jgi:hypothetical protein